MFQLLKCLKNQLIDFEVEVFVVVDGSNDGTIEMINSNFPEVKVVFGDGNLWYTKSINEGLINASKLNPDFYLLLNDDLLVEDDYLQSLINSYQKVEKNSIIGSLSVTNDLNHTIFFSGVKTIENWRAKRIMYLPYGEAYDAKEHKGVFSSEVLPARGMLIPSQVYNKLGLLDESFPQYGSDDEYSLRAHKFNIPVYISFDSVVYTDQKSTGKGSPYTKPKFNVFFMSIFSRYSPVSIKKDIRIYWKYGNIFVFPLTIFFIFIKPFGKYFKYKFLSK